MATSSSHLKCPTCLQEYNTPKLLPCLHSICQNCLEKCIENSTVSEEKLYQFQCPVCMKIVTKQLSDLPVEQWAGHFPVNAVLLSLLPKAKTKVDKLCDPCLYEGTSIGATSYCATCKETLCGVCYSAHRKSRATREHSFLTLDEIADPQVALSLLVGITCTYHLNKDVKFYCASHDSMCCSDCVVDYHRGCNEMLKLKQHADKLFKAEEPLMITERIKQLESHLDKYTAASNETLKELENSTEDMTIEIDKLIATLNEAKSKISMERKGLLEEESRKRHDESQQCQSLQAALRDSLILLDAVVKYGHKHQSLVILHKIKEQLEYCEKTIHEKHSEVRQVEAKLQLNEHFISLRKVTDTQVAKIEMTENKLKLCLPFPQNYTVGSDSIHAMSDEGLLSTSTTPRDLASDEDENAVEKSSDFDEQKIRASDFSSTLFEISEGTKDGNNESLEPMRKKGEAMVTSEDTADAERLCMKPHITDKKDIQVCLYYECLDADKFSDLTHETEDTMGQLQLPDPVELKNLKPQIVRFLVKNEKHRQVFEKNLSDINGVAKWPSSLEDYVIIECTLKVEDKSASSFLKDWSIRVVDEVKSFAAGIGVAEFNLRQMAWLRVLEELKTIINPEDVGVFAEQDKYKITVAGPRAAVEKLTKIILDTIAKVETQIALEKQRVTEIKQMKTYEMTLLRASRFKQDIEQMYPGLQFDLNQKDRRAIFVGQADIVQKAVVKMHEKLQSFVSVSMPMSTAAMDLLFVKEISDYIKQKIISQKMIGIWDVVRKKEVRMFGRDEREVQKAIQLIKSCLVEKEISLDNVMVQNVKGQQWLQLVERIQEKHTRKVAIETRMTSILVVAVDDIFQDVFNEIKGYLEKHSVQDIILALEQVRVKFIKRYKMEDIKALEKRFESSHIKLLIIDHGDQRGIKINGTKDGCKEVKTALAEMAKDVTIKEHVMASKIGLKELLQSSRGRDQLSSIEFRCQCFIEMKYSSTSGSQQQEGASGGYSSGSEEDASQSYEPTDWQPSSDSGGAISDAGGIKVSVIQGELAKQRVDVIVNSTSQKLDLNTGQISKTILKYGGDTIQRGCLQQYPNGINPGQVVVTSGGKLSCTNVYHGCLRAYDGGHGNSIELMKTFVINCLKQADQSGLQSMAFPALGTGQLGFPADEVGKLMVQCIQTFGKARPNTSLKDITLVVYPSDINIIKAFTTVLGGTTVPSASIPRNARLSSNISIASQLPAFGKSFKERSKPNSLVFSITMDSESNFKAAVRDLEGFVKNEITEKVINSPREIISKLLDRQVTKMEGMGQGKAMVSVKRKKGVILVSGAPREVLEIYDNIMKYLHNIERDKMKENREKLKTQQAMSDLSLPSIWTKMAPNENMKCVTLNPSDKEYNDVSQKFLASARSAGQQSAAYGYGINFGHQVKTGLTVIQIERVQNKTLYQQYKAKKRHMEQQNNGVANEKELWHGTAGINIANISNNGFNRGYGVSGSHGAGTYFAVNASYSVANHCRPDAVSGHRHIYLASVLTGDSIVAGSATRVLPPKDPRYPHITYDSTTDNTVNSQIFVIFHDTQAYPSYLITFY